MRAPLEHWSGKVTPVFKTLAIHKNAVSQSAKILEGSACQSI